MLDPQLVALLVCPDCRQPVREEQDCLVCTGCQKRYPIRDGIPMMLIEEAEAPTRP
jgi:uncharacterized protein YbaR (Trm112 family)